MAAAVFYYNSSEFLLDAIISMLEGSQSEYARHRGCTPGAVSEAIKKGRLKNSLRRHGKRWRINFDEADREWRDRSMRRVTDPSPDEPAPPPPDDEVERQLQSGNLSYGEARTLTEISKARTGHLEYLKKRGELVEIAKIKTEVFDIFRVMRDRLLAAPPRFAHAALSAESEAAAILAIKAELNQVLDDANHAIDSGFTGN